MSLCKILFLCISCNASSKLPIMKDVVYSESVEPFEMISKSCPSHPSSRTMYTWS